MIAVAILCGWLAWSFHREPITAANVKQLRLLKEMPCEGIYRLVYSPDRSSIAFVTWERPVVIRENITLWQLRTVGDGRKLIGFDFGPHGQQVAYTENSTRAEILRAPGDKPLVLETGNDQPDVEFSPDGKLLATGGFGTEAKLWETTTGKLIHKLDSNSQPGGLTPLFSPDGKILAVGNRNATTKLFDVATGQCLQTLPIPSTQELAFHPSGKTLAVAYADGSLRLWETATGKLIAERWKVAEEIYTLDWSPDGELLASAGLDGDICIWNKDLQLLRSIPAPVWVISVKFSPDGTRLVTAGGPKSDGTQTSVKIWGVRPSITQLWDR